MEINLMTKVRHWEYCFKTKRWARKTNMKSSNWCVYVVAMFSLAYTNFSEIAFPVT